MNIESLLSEADPMHGVLIPEPNSPSECRANAEQNSPCDAVRIALQGSPNWTEMFSLEL